MSKVRQKIVGKSKNGALGKVLKGADIIGIGMAGFGAISSYNSYREEGSGIAPAIMKAGTEFALSEMMGLPGQLGLMAANTIPRALVNGGQTLDMMARDMQKQSIPLAFNNASFNDTQANYTMRQAGMKLAQASKYNLQQTLMGNEAQYMAN